MSDEEQIVAHCFDYGTVGEGCDDCPAHPNNATEFECCFGTKHEFNDTDCRRCEYEGQCSKLTHGRSHTRIPKRIVVRSRTRPTTSYSLQKTGVDQSKPLIPDVVEAPRNRTSVQEHQEEFEEPFVNRLMRKTGWGMIEGGLQMALSFFQKNRPE